MTTRSTIITGAAAGIGAALAKRLALNGDQLTLVDVDMDGLKALLVALALPEKNVVLVKADVSSVSDVEGYVRTALDNFGRVDCFANNAGIEGPSGLMEDISVGAFDRVYAVNVRSVFLGLRNILPFMKQQRSRSIVNTASLASLWGLPKLGAYIMSKHAVAGLTKVAALEAAEHGVRVNAVLPGLINTGMMTRIEHGGTDAEKAREAFTASTPMRRYGEPDEVAAVMEFLLSDKASFVTSSLYTVDGGALWQ